MIQKRLIYHLQLLKRKQQNKHAYRLRKTPLFNRVQSSDYLYPTTQ
ncbi:MAG: hypothetical protein RI894_907 [Bacteroidota bacterium]|jgi:hypothetical protein